MDLRSSLGEINLCTQLTACSSQHNTKNPDRIWCWIVNRVLIMCRNTWWHVVYLTYIFLVIVSLFFNYHSSWTLQVIFFFFGQLATNSVGLVAKGFLLSASQKRKQKCSVGECHKCFLIYCRWRCWRELFFYGILVSSVVLVCNGRIQFTTSQPHVDFVLLTFILKCSLPTFHCFSSLFEPKNLHLLAL